MQKIRKCLLVGIVSLVAYFHGVYFCVASETAGSLRDRYHYSFSLKVARPEETKQKYGELLTTCMTKS